MRENQISKIKKLLDTLSEEERVDLFSSYSCPIENWLYEVTWHVTVRVWPHLIMPIEWDIIEIRDWEYKFHKLRQFWKNWYPSINQEYKKFSRVEGKLKRL